MTLKHNNYIKKWYNDYVSNFLVDYKQLKSLLELKLDHSIYVAAHSKAIAIGEGWSQSDILVSEVIGLLHDTGRFFQIVEFQTFSDPDSLDHGELGFKIVKESSVLSSLSESGKKIILDSIHYHNTREIPDYINPDSLRFVKLIRDADKLDIFRVISDAIHNNKIEDHPEITLNIDINGPVNPAALAQILDKKTIEYRNIKSLADFGLTQLSWIYDVNYRYTLNQIAERGILEEIIDLLPKDKEVLKAAKSVSEYMAQKIQFQIFSN